MLMRTLSHEENSVIKVDLIKPIPDFAEIKEKNVFTTTLFYLGYIIVTEGLLSKI